MKVAPQPEGAKQQASLLTRRDTQTLDESAALAPVERNLAAVPKNHQPHQGQFDLPLRSPGQPRRVPLPGPRRDGLRFAPRSFAVLWFPFGPLGP